MNPFLLTQPKFLDIGKGIRFDQNASKKQFTMFPFTRTAGSFHACMIFNFNARPTLIGNSSPGITLFSFLESNFNNVATDYGFDFRVAAKSGDPTKMNFGFYYRTSIGAGGSIITTTDFPYDETGTRKDFIILNYDSGTQNLVVFHNGLMLEITGSLASNLLHSGVGNFFIGSKSYLYESGIDLHHFSFGASSLTEEEMYYIYSGGLGSDYLTEAKAGRWNSNDFCFNFENTLSELIQTDYGQTSNGYTLVPRGYQVTGLSNSGGLVLVTTALAHGMATGNTVNFTGLTLNPSIITNNTDYLITFVSTTTFTIQGSNSTGLVTDKGTVTRIYPITSVTTGTTTNITCNSHGLIAGQYVTISGALGNTDINGTWLVTSPVTSNAFEINCDTTASGSYTASSAELTWVSYFDSPDA